MLKVSCTQINFNRSQSIKTLILQNQFKSNMIFKIKVNIKDFINIEPNRGFIRSNSSVSFIIKSIKKQKYQAKVLFTYSLINNQNNNFNQQWDNIKQKSQFQHQILSVRRSEDFQGFKNNNMKDKSILKRKSRKVHSLQKNIRQKKLTMSLTQSLKANLQKNKLQQSTKSKQQIRQNKQQIKSKKQLSKSQQQSKKRQQSKLKQSNRCSLQVHQKQLYEQGIMQSQLLYSPQQMQQVIHELHSTQLHLQSSRINGLKLLQQLQISQNKLKQVIQDKKFNNVHNSIGIVCQDYHMTFIMLLICVLTSFLIGFMLGKIQIIDQ